MGWGGWGFKHVHVENIKKKPHVEHYILLLLIMMIMMMMMMNVIAINTVNWSTC